ncbi:MAG: hypothetical protein CVU03_00610 [Bacteroidetes bacterium HGW-Bacteroidetes-2]|jgi:hypothetical protein|nr:MAG: hypothetical protein CVU03_00610 [Bacteroidetes bacterium HGW-Bacteroidetes-2]
MKKFRLNKIFTLLLALVVVTSCVKDDDFDTPNLNFDEPNISTNDIIEISAVAGILAQSSDPVVTFSETGKFIQGYVISSDEGGNFFKQIIIQDLPENPTRGIKVLVDVSPLFVSYEVGRKVFIKLDGLTVGTSNGVLGLGIRNGNNVARIPFPDRENFILRSNTIAEIVPLPLGIENFTTDKTNLFIRLTDVQFNRNDVLVGTPKTFAAEPADQFDGERIVESCASGSSAILSTSTFASFKGLRLPKERGSLDVILTRDFFDDFFTFYLNTPAGINFDNAERCDPTEVNCGLATTTGTQVLFSDNFETQSVNSPISGNGWTNFIQAGTKPWEAYVDNGANASLGISARCGSFNSGDASTVSWLITPQIALSTATAATIQFKTSNSFSDGSEMQVLFSSDWDGTPANIVNATWDQLSDATLVQDSTPFPDWIFSGIVDLSCIQANGYFAFKYTGSGQAAFDGTFELDEIVINAQ